MRNTGFFFLLLTVCVKGHPNGAPDDLCDAGNLTPKHGLGLVKPKDLNSVPYTITASADKFSSDKDTITVTIKADNKDKPFRGFAVSAKDGSKKKLIGSWDDTSKSHPLRCSSIVTHDNRNTKTSVELKWHPPKGASAGTVVFSATVVQKYTSFWINVPVKVAK